tara:strand:- start:573 stop:1052 length:480 start_codon:yes stop_codon:yes gene_type:complete
VEKLDLAGNIRQLDRFDRQIIAILSADGRLPVTDLAKRIGMSKSPCQSRVKRLQEDGYILGFRAVLNPHKLGREHVAFTEVTLSDTREAALKAFNAAVQKVPEIEQCHMIAGSCDYLLKIRTADILAYRKILGETITTLPHVSNTSTSVSMEAVKDFAF